MAKLSETKIPMTEFLEAYRRQPCLYNSLLDTYKNRGAREQAYEAIIRSLKISHLTVLDIKLKIKSVRTVYTKELRILMREKDQGKCYVPKLFWFKRADSFLRSVSLSHCKRLKNKDGSDVEGGGVAIKREAAPPPKLLLNDTAINAEDTLHDGAEDGSRLSEHLDDHYNTDLDEQAPKTMASTGTNTNPAPNASCQTDDVNSPTATRRSSKHELMIDDSTLSNMDQQQQQQPTVLRKLKYINYAQSHPAQLQQPHRLATPFTATSPSQQGELAPSTNAALCFAGPNGSSDDDLVIFGQSIASQLRTIPDPYSRSVAKLRIQQVLFEAETGQSSDAVTPQLHNF